LRILAWAQCALDEPDASSETMRDAARFVPSVGARHVMHDWFAAADSFAAWKAGRCDEAIALARRATAIARDSGGIFSEGLAHRTWALALSTLGAEVEEI